MMRSLWTAASGMIGQQSNLDVIANNLSNISTTGYKTQAANFKTLIYQNLQKNSTTTTGEPNRRGAGRIGRAHWRYIFGFYAGKLKCFERAV